MVGLWADGWFYISSAGLLISGVLFLFLLGQYRVASEAADSTEVEAGEDKDAHATESIRPVYNPEPSPAPKVVSHAETPAPKTPEPATESRRDPANTIGGLSPAVVYLQNIKTELAELHKEMNALAKRVDERLAKSATRDEALIERLGELSRAIETIKVAAEPAQTAPKKALKAEETIRVDLSVLAAPAPVAAEAAPPAEAPAPSTEAPPEEKTRRGPVWPV